MGGVRKLFISNTGFDKFADVVYNTTKDNKDQAFVDILACREYIMRQFKLASKLPKVSSISLTDSGELRIRTRDLFISNSDTGKLRKFFVGKWKIVATPDGDYVFHSMNKTELGFYSDIWGNGTVHPHISGRSGHGCLGNAEAPLQLYLKTGAIKTLAIYIIGYLESVNINDSAGVALGHCKEVALDEDGNVLHDEEGNYKFIQNEFDREHTHTIANTTATNVDKEHHEYITRNYGVCTGCNKVYNVTYLSPVGNNTGIYVCEDCKKNLKTCPICGNLATKTIHDPVNDMDYCEDCVNTWFHKCKLCNDYIFPELDKDNIEESLMKLKDLDMRKQNTVITLRRDVLYISYVCNSCLDILKGDKLEKIKLPTFKKVEVDNTLASLEMEIPFDTYKTKCYSCRADINVENLAVSNIAAVDQNVCGHCLMLPSERVINAVSKYRMTDKYIRDKYVRLSTHIEDNNIVIHVLPYDDKIGILLPRAAFKDSTVWNTIKEDETIKYNIEGRE